MYNATLSPSWCCTKCTNKKYQKWLEEWVQCKVLTLTTFLLYLHAPHAELCVWKKYNYI